MVLYHIILYDVWMIFVVTIVLLFPSIRPLFGGACGWGDVLPCHVQSSGRYAEVRGMVLLHFCLLRSRQGLS